MLQGFLKKFIGSRNERELKKLNPIVAQINELEPQMEALSDEELQAQTVKFRARLDEGEDLDSLLPEAFATVREAGKRVLGMRHYDVQLIGGMILHRGSIAEMKTGEGKTLVATCPVYLNALTRKGVHLVTVNDYLARRDAEWMGQLYRWLGLTVGVVLSDMAEEEKREAYRADITYGQNNEFGFDYLRDNMKFSLDRFVQRPHHFAVIDEVDSILIDEARTPLIISGKAEKSSDLYHRVNDLIRPLKRDQDFIVDEKAHSCTLTEVGVDRLERKLSLDNIYAPDHTELLHHINQALKAHNLFKRDSNYLVEGGKVVIIDEHTGRKMPGRRWSDGLHQAVEAKEGLQIQDENQTLATVTFQNYFRMYDKLSGMTGTAETEAEEFMEIYGLDCFVIPTNKPIARLDHDDVVFVKERFKVNAIVEDIIECHKKKQPVLVGTTSVEKSEFISRLLSKNNVKHHVLNAKFHEQEASIVAQAGQLGAVTIATNMAGRGTDIMLGGNPEFLARLEVGEDGTDEAYEAALERLKVQCEQWRTEVLDAGGLHIIGTERHESRRIDNQLRGRAGRQGDPGSSRFYLSMEDDLLRVFGGERLQGLMEKFNVPDDEPMEHKWVTKSLVNAQRKVEGRNFDIRKNLLEYDDVMNIQRETVYKRRAEVLKGEFSLHDAIEVATEGVVGDKVHRFHSDVEDETKWDHEGLKSSLEATFKFPVNVSADDLNTEEVIDRLTTEIFAEYVRREKAIIENLVVSSRYDVEERFALQKAQAEKEGQDLGRLVVDEEKLLDAKTAEWQNYERVRYLQTVDSLWKDHLQELTRLKEGIHLHSYAQKDPKLIYKQESYELFLRFWEAVDEKIVDTVYQQDVQSSEEIQKHIESRRKALEKKLSEMKSVHPSAAQSSAGAPQAKQEERTRPETYRRERPKIGRNDPCWCGSGKKYKKCHYLIDLAEKEGTQGARAVGE